MSVLEVLIGIVIFVLLFTYIMSAFAPTATDYQGMVRGYSTAVTVANWYVNRIEGILHFQGSLPAGEMGLNKDVTAVCRANFGDLMDVELKKVRVVSNVFKPKPDAHPGLYQIDVFLSWSGRGAKTHEYSMKRLKAASRF